jgi:tryptophan synthase beta subunit
MNTTASTITTKTDSLFLPDELGFYGDFGGAFVPELLRPNCENLSKAFNEYCYSESFETAFIDLLKNYTGRPTTLYFSEKLSQKYGGKIFLKREDLCHTGSHKINNALGQILLAKYMGKTEIIAETGAGQHGVACATVCALMDMKCIVFMGEKDIERQAPNVQRMRLLGAEVRPAKSGSKTLKDATNEAIRHWINHPEAYYLIGSVVGPHPYPKIVAHFQQVISKEIKKQLKELEISAPTKIIACVGGGSNAAGAFYHFYEDPNVELIAVEAAGLGIDSGKSAATSILGKMGVLHGSLTLLMQDENGQVVEPHSISAGLDYPGIGPLHAHSIQTKRTKSIAVTDDEAMKALIQFCQFEGIIPAIESAHALAALEKIELKENEIVVVNLSGRGDKDLETIINYQLKIEKGISRKI